MLSSKYRASPEDYWDYLHTPSFGPAYNASAMPRQNMRAIDEDDFGEQGGDPRFVGHLGGAWGAVAMEPNRGDRTPFVPQRGPGWQGPAAWEGGVSWGWGRRSGQSPPDPGRVGRRR